MRERTRRKENIVRERERNLYYISFSERDSSLVILLLFSSFFLLILFSSPRSYRLQVVCFRSNRRPRGVGATESIRA